MGGVGDEIQNGWGLGDYGFGRNVFLDYKKQASGKTQAVITESTCDLPGVQYRHFLIRGRAFPLWSLTVSLWCKCQFSLFKLVVRCDSLSAPNHRVQKGAKTALFLRSTSLAIRPCWPVLYLPTCRALALAKAETFTVEVEANYG